MGIPLQSIPKHLRPPAPTPFSGQARFLLECRVPTVGLHCKTRDHHDLPDLRAAKELYERLIPPARAPFKPPYRVRLAFAMPGWLGKPDLDNLAKVLLDCVKRSGWMVDDAGLVLLQASKHKTIHVIGRGSIHHGVWLEIATLVYPQDEFIANGQPGVERYS